MLFDITFSSHTGTPREMIDLAIIAERLGYNGIWVTHDPLWDNSWVLCGAIGHATNRIEIGPGIVNPYSSTTTEIAMATATLSNLIGSRAVLGFGPGSKKMLEDCGLSHTDLFDTMDRSVSYLKRALNPRTSDLRIRPLNHVPIFIGCQSPKLLERVGMWDVGGLILLTPPAYARQALGFIEAGAKRVGKSLDKSKIVAAFLSLIHKDEQEARRQFAPFLTFIIKYLSKHQLESASITPKDVKEILHRYNEKGWESLPDKVFELGVVGLERCFKVIEELEKLGFRRVKLGTPLGGNKEEAIHLFAKEVMPHFKK